MFYIGSTSRYILVSPLLRTLIVIVLTALILISIGALKWFIRHSKSHQWLATVQRTFRQTDVLVSTPERKFIGSSRGFYLFLAGRRWDYGRVDWCPLPFLFWSALLTLFPLATFVNIQRNRSLRPPLLTIHRFVMSSTKQVWNHSPCRFRQKNSPCSIFWISSSSLSTWISWIAVASCRIPMAWQMVGSSTRSLLLLSCSNSGGNLSTSVRLPYQGVTIQCILVDVQVVGAVRMDLQDDEYEKASYVLRKLDFRRTFDVELDRIFAQAATVNLQLSKVTLVEYEYIFSDILSFIRWSMKPDPSQASSRSFSVSDILPLSWIKVCCFSRMKSVEHRRKGQRPRLPWSSVKHPFLSRIANHSSQSAHSSAYKHKQQRRKGTSSWCNRGAWPVERIIYSTTISPFFSFGNDLRCCDLSIFHYQ